METVQLTSIPRTLSQRYIGKPVKRKEDRRLVSGLRQYVDDVSLPAMLYVAFLRSPYAHAKIRKVEVTSDYEASAVQALLTGEDVVRMSDPFPHLARLPNVKIPQVYSLAVDKVRFVGEPVVAVASDSRYTAEDALEGINVEYEELPPLLDTESAIKSKVLVHEEIQDNLYAHSKIDTGDVESAFKQSDVVIEKKFRIQRHTGTPIEPHGIIASYSKDLVTLTVWAATQIPHDLRAALSRSLRIPEAKITVIASDVGGGFGNYKYHPEDFAVCLLSIKAGKPVKWIANRSELFLAGYHAREQVHYAKMGVDRSGKILALQDRIFASMGAYLPRETIGPPSVAASLLPGPYKITNLSVDLFCVAVNKAPSGAYRGFGQPQANFVIERLIDMAARELNMDPAEIRLKNFIPKVEFPYRSATGQDYDSGDYVPCLRKALDLVDYERLHNRLKEFNRTSSRIKKGIGIGFYVEVTNYSFPHSRDRMTLKLDETGRASVLTGLMPHGQGLETTLAQIAAEFLGLEIDEVDVIFGNTSTTPYGQGTFGSRSATSATENIMAASELILVKARETAADLLGSRSEDLEISGGKFFVKGASNRSIHIREIARRARSVGRLGSDLEATVVYENHSGVFSYGVHVALVDVDLETGNISISDYAIVHDCGTVLNPMIVEGQMHGGLAQGLGGAALEELVYDNSGQLLSSSFLDYLIPCAPDVPNVRIDHTMTPSPLNRFGVKGVGEGSVIPVSAALANGIEDALSEFELRITALPLKPEAVWTLIQQRK